MRRRCVTEGVSQKHGVTCQYEAYERARQKQSLTSGLEILTRILENQREWISCWIGEKKQERNTWAALLQPTDFYISVLVVLTTLSQLMSAKMDETILHVKCYINGQIAITVAGSYLLVLLRYWSPSPSQNLTGSWVQYLAWHSKYLAPKIALHTPAQTHPFTPPLAPRPPPPPPHTQRTDGMTLMGKNP